MAVVTGAQDYVIAASAISPSSQDVTSRLLSPWLTRRFIHGRSVLDLGANGGFYTFSSIQQGSSAVTAVDIDDDSLALIASVRDHLGYDTLKIAKANVADWAEPADIVFALGLVHWAQGRSPAFGSLDSIGQRLSNLSRHMLLTEWAGPDDPAVKSFGPLGSSNALRGPCSIEAFAEALRSRFARVEEIGAVTPTRRLFMALREPHEVDLSDPLPRLTRTGRLIASRNLVRLGGIDHWSRVYLDSEEGGSVTKHTSLDLAYRESLFLRVLSGPYFPRVLGASHLEASSTVEIERIDGVPLEQGVAELCSSASRYLEFAGHCLGILSALQARGITHRDIRPGNILLRGGVPVLIDFGWAVSRDLPMSAAGMLGLEGRPPDGVFCDVYAMGKVLAWVKGGAFPPLDAVLERMTDPEARLRITDTAVLGYLFGVAEQEVPAPREKGPILAGNEGDPAAAAVQQLLRQVSELTQRVRALETQVDGSTTELAAQREGFNAVSTQFLQLKGGVELAAERAEQIARLEEEVARLQTVIARLEAASRDAEKRNADLANVKSHADRLEVALATARGVVAAQASRIVYLEGEVDARLWRKVVSYARRKLRSR